MVEFKFKVDNSGMREEIKELKEEERKLRREASRQASMANKRLKRLEEQDLTNTPAFRSWYDEGGVKFGVKGKSNRELQHEMARMKRFLKMQTSTVRGAKQNLENVAKRINIYHWDNYKDLEQQISNYYSLQSKVLEYSSNIKEIGVSLNYEKVGEYVADYLQETNGKMIGTGEEIAEITEKILAGMAHEKGSELLEQLAKKLDNMTNF